MIFSSKLSSVVGILGFVSGLGDFVKIWVLGLTLGSNLISIHLPLFSSSTILGPGLLGFWLSHISLMLNSARLGCLSSVGLVILLSLLLEFFGRFLPQKPHLDLSRITGRDLQEVASDSTPLGQRPLSVLPVANRLWASLRLGHLREWVEGWLPQSVFSLGNGLSSVEAWFSTALDIEEVLAGTGGDQLHVMVADVIKSFDTVDRSILDCALGRLGLPDWFRKVYFSFHSQVRLRFKLAAGLGKRWCRDGGIPQGCPLLACAEVHQLLPGQFVVGHGWNG